MISKVHNITPYRYLKNRAKQVNPDMGLRVFFISKLSQKRQFPQQIPKLLPPTRPDEIGSPGQLARATWIHPSRKNRVFCLRLYLDFAQTKLGRPGDSPGWPRIAQTNPCFAFFSAMTLMHRNPSFLVIVPEDSYLPIAAPHGIVRRGSSSSSRGRFRSHMLQHKSSMVPDIASFS